MHPISELLCAIYNDLLDRREVSFPLTEENIRKMDSVVKTVNANYFGVERFPDPEIRAAAYLCLIIKDHPFTDGNKRTAVFFFQVYCEANKLVVDPFMNLSLDQIAVSIEKSKNLNNERLINLVRKLLFR